MSEHQKDAKAQFLAEHQRKGEHYAGLILGKNGEPDHHVILLPGDTESVTWQQAKEFAEKSGGELPTRREQSLLYANLKELFQSARYWSGEQRESFSDGAWYQGFYTGNQDWLHKRGKLRARAVRRLPI